MPRLAKRPLAAATACLLLVLSLALTDALSPVAHASGEEDASAGTPLEADNGGDDEVDIGENDDGQDEPSDDGSEGNEPDRGHDGEEDGDGHNEEDDGTDGLAEDADAEAGEDPGTELRDADGCEDCADVDCAEQDCADCGCAHVREPSVAPYADEDGWAVVTDQDGLRAAVADKQPRIRLGADITMNQPIDVAHDMVLDGEREDGGRWTLQTGNVFALQGSDLTFTAQNLNVYTTNVYGLVASPNYAQYSGADVYIQDVYFDGPQVAYLRNEGMLHLYDSDFVIGSDEVGECTQFILGGRIDIRKTGGNSLFWIFNEGRTNARQGLLRFEDGADVFLYSRDSYLTWREENENGVDRYDIEIGDGVRLEMQTAQGWTYNSTRYVDNLTVGEGSTVVMRRLTGGAPMPWYIKQSLRVGRGSTLIIEDGAPAVNIIGAQALIEFDEPELVRIDSSITGNRPSAITMTAKAFNSWTTAQDPGSDAPAAMLNAPGGEPVTVTITAGEQSAHYTDAQTGGQVALDGAAALDPSANSGRLALGSYALEVDDIAATATALTGAVSPGAALDAAFYTKGVDTPQRTSAVRDPGRDADGLHGFAISTEESAANGFSPDKPVVFHLARDFATDDLGFLPTRLWATEQRLPAGGVYLAAYPEALDFGLRAMPGAVTYYPLVRDAAAKVTDTRTTAAGEWMLTAWAGRLLGEGTGRALDADAIGIMVDGVFRPLSGGQVVWSSDRGGEQEKVFAAGDAEGGLVVRVDPYSAAADSYRAQVVWTLSVGP